MNIEDDKQEKLYFPRDIISVNFLHNDVLHYTINDKAWLNCDIKLFSSCNNA